MIIGIGHDVVEVERIGAILSRSAGTSFISRVLTPREREHALVHFGDELQNGRWVEYTAGRFAAKEAVVKAFGCGIGAQTGFQDICVLPDEAGKPICELSKASYDKLGFDPQSITIHVSITHTQELASAFAIVERR